MWAHCMRIIFAQLACISSSRIWQTTARKYRVGLHNILLGAGAVPRMGPPHACNIYTIGSCWPFKDMADCRTKLSRGPT